MSEVRTHFILAGTMVQARFLAAALRLPDHTWTLITSVDQFRAGTPSAIHIIPGADATCAGAAIGLSQTRQIPLYRYP